MEEEKKEKSCKIVLLGESGVGKTSIIDRFLNGRFSPDISPSQGASYGTKTIDLDETGEKKLKFDIWDTAGQEKFRSISKIFYRDADAVIFVYDITNKKSFEEIQNYWYKQVEDSSSKNINKYYFI